MTRVLLMWILLAPAADEAALDKRVMALSEQLRCLVCQNQTIADSQADLARDLRQQIREQMRAGRTDAEVTTFLTDRYGDYVLYRPPVKPETYLLWFGPFALLGAGLTALFRFLKRWPTTKRQPLSAEQRRRAAELLRSGKNPNIDIYRDQFAEMKRELRQGLLVREQYDRDREELDRRLLDDCG